MGNYAQAEWYFNKLNGLYPEQVKFTLDYSGEDISKRGTIY